MAVVTLAGTDLVMSVEGVVIGCAQEITVELTTAMTEATCQASGGFSEFVPGKHTWTASSSGLIRYSTLTDIPLNVTRKELIDYQIARTPIEITFGSEKVGDSVYTGTAFISSTSQSGGGDEASFSVNFQGSGPLVPSVVAA